MNPDECPRCHSENTVTLTHDRATHEAFKECLDCGEEFWIDHDPKEGQ